MDIDRERARFDRLQRAVPDGLPAPVPGPWHDLGSALEHAMGCIVLAERRVIYARFARLAPHLLDLAVLIVEPDETSYPEWLDESLQPAVPNSTAGCGLWPADGADEEAAS